MEKVKEILKLLEGCTLQQAISILNIAKSELEQNSIVKVKKD